MVLRNGEGASGTRRNRDIGLDQGNLIDLDVTAIVDDDLISGFSNDSLDDHLAKFGRSDDNDISAGDRFCPIDASSHQQLARVQRRGHRTGPNPRQEGDPAAHHQTESGGAKNGRDPNDQHRTHEDTPFIHSSGRQHPRAPTQS
ncbi:hypothetical protein GCM10023067_50010 [Aminobacter aganoensis]